MKQMRLPMVAPVRPRIVSTEERKGKEKTLDYLVVMYSNHFQKGVLKSRGSIVQLSEHMW